MRVSPCSLAAERVQVSRRSWTAATAELAKRQSVILAYRVPVHHVPPGFDVVGTPVLILKIISMLPNIDAENRRVAVHQRAVLVWRRNDFKLSVLILDQPRPAAAKTSRTSGSKFLFEIVEAPECRFDIIGELAFRFAAGIRSHYLPK